MKMFLILLIFGGTIFPSAENAASGFFPSLTNAEAETRDECAFKTYIEDEDPDGTNIRAAAGKNSAVLKRIETQSAAVVTVAGYSNGWFEITAVKEVDGGGAVLFRGRGWIHSSLLGMRVAESDARLYAEAKKGSRVLMKLKPEETPLKLVACAGDWVKVQTGGKTGWLAPGGQCGNPLTTCP